MGHTTWSTQVLASPTDGPRLPWHVLAGKTAEVTHISIEDSKAIIAQATDPFKIFGEYIGLRVAEGKGLLDEPIWNAGKGGDLVTLEQYLADPQLSADKHWYRAG